MKYLLSKLFDRETLSENEAFTALTEITSGKCNEFQIASFLTVFNVRAITLDEIVGFKKALMQSCKTIDFTDFDCIDLCGTGGDTKSTFNVSTISSFVVAGAGYKVAKHGNYGVSSVSGSSNIMENLGYYFTNNYDNLRRQLDSANICFLHAPLFHPSMKTVANVRRNLGLKTFFNMLGPMVNPSSPNNQMVGVYSLELAKLYNFIYQKTDKNYSIIHSVDGYDEISLTGEFKCYSDSGENLFSPKDIGFEIHSQESVKGADSLDENFKIFENVISGNGTKQQNNIVLANSMMAIKTISGKSFEQSKQEAKDSLLGGKAHMTLKKLLENQ